MNSIYGAIGPVKDGAVIEDNTGFDTLNKEQVIIKRQLTLVLADGTKADLANPEYLEFSNSEKGRVAMKGAAIAEQYKGAILAVWGDKPTVEDPKLPE